MSEVPDGSVVHGGNGPDLATVSPQEPAAPAAPDAVGGVAQGVDAARVGVDEAGVGVALDDDHGERVPEPVVVTLAPEPQCDGTCGTVARCERGCAERLVPVPAASDPRCHACGVAYSEAFPNGRQTCLVCTHRRCVECG